MVPTKDIRRVQRGCTDKTVRELLLAILRGGHRYRMTKSGVMVFGAEGTASAHFTGSDRRAISNFRADLKRIGINI